jgi:ABC-type Zn uptake system ZnuABC Zn-binding protein ZnuA
MKTTKKMHRLLERMAQIGRMERGKLCRMGERPHYNHQSWQDGRNIVRYVAADETDFVQEAIDGYRQFAKLAEQYADEVITQTRREREKLFPKPETAKKREPTR